MTREGISKIIILIVITFVVSSCSIGTSLIVRNYSDKNILFIATLNFNNEKIQQKYSYYLSDSIIKNKEFDIYKFDLIKEFSRLQDSLVITIPPRSTLFIDSKRIIEKITFKDNFGNKLEENKKGMFFRTGSKTYYYNIKE